MKEKTDAKKLMISISSIKSLKVGLCLPENLFFEIL